MQMSQLRYFAAIAQLENMSQAAELLHMSQSSLSKNLARLEAEVGMPLFERNGRKLKLNAAGTRLLEYSSMTLRELEYALADMRLLSTGTDARIKIGAAGAGARLTACVAAFHQEHPEAEFDISGGIEGLEHPDINDFDMLIYPAGSKYRKFNGFPLYEERYLLAVPGTHPLARCAALQVKALEGEQVVFLREGRSFVEYPFQICGALAQRFGGTCYADSRDLHRQMIASGVCVGFVPEDSAAFYRADRSLRLIPIPDHRFTRQMMVCFRREKHLSSLARTFRDFAMAYFGLSVSSERQ